MVTIGHASISENRTINGAAGDSTGKEVCKRSWYSKPWTYLLRPKTAAIANGMVKACMAGCDNDNIGYSQATRNTAHSEAKKVGYDLSRISTKCNTDCSAFMTLCAIAAGVTELEYSGNAPTTSTMKDAFIRTGKFVLITDTAVLSSDKYLRKGDVLVKPGSHTVMVLTDGVLALNPVSTNKTEDYSFTTFVKELQRSIGTLVDGIPGPETLKKAPFLSATVNRKHSAVIPVQKYLNWIGYNCGTVDGITGPKFTEAVKKFQKDSKIEIDGEIYTETWKRLLKMS